MHRDSPLTCDRSLKKIDFEADRQVECTLSIDDLEIMVNVGCGCLVSETSHLNNDVLFFKYDVLITLFSRVAFATQCKNVIKPSEELGERRTKVGILSKRSNFTAKVLIVIIYY
ncbi:hypothetical protein A374_13460 [Fictibacillus macauensis ZFHKF-1]|uniref:Uncharacterized protein n=1 Tax=Fictibacillus macauensis ZFHKF-1 TaxID=1196324 RepID=I8AGA1_9BACL|nr:hypothetical protein A374_13460 [Fictibacillus macauensis ZFHKF-1]